ncbi:MAG TPA: nuclear transport factor 2 family protein [Streptosporangiaceae bacterium]
MQATEEFLTEWAAAEQAGDTRTLETLLDGGFTAVGPLGFILPKQAWLARHRSRDLTYQDFSLDEVQGRPIGQDAAVVTARTNTSGATRATRSPRPPAPPWSWSATAAAGSWPPST